MKQYRNDTERATPEGWTVAPLEKLVEILDSQRIPINAKDREKRQRRIPYFGATGQVGWIDDHLFDEELVLLGEDGAPFLDSTKPKSYIIRGKSWVNNHAHVLRCLGSVPAQYLKYYLDQFDYSGFVTGTTRLKLNQRAMRRIPIWLAPQKEQRRIAERLEAIITDLDSVVDNLRRVQAQLKRYRQAVLKYAVEGKLTAEWRERHKGEIEPADLLLKRILAERRAKWEEQELAKMKAKGKIPKDDKWKKKYKEPKVPDTDGLPELPDGWVWTNVTTVAELIQYGTSEKAGQSPEGIIVLRMGNIQDGDLNYDVLKYLPADWVQTEEFVLGPGDVLFNRTNSAELVGKTAVYKDHHPQAVFASYLIRVRTNMTAYNPDLLSSFINSCYGRKYIASVVSQQVGQANVNGTKLSVMPIPLPSFMEQQEITTRVEELLSVAWETEHIVRVNLSRAERLKQTILRKAFSGRLVPQDSSDEPASALLELIKAEREKEQAAKKRSKTRKPSDKPKRKENVEPVQVELPLKKRESPASVSARTKTS